MHKNKCFFLILIFLELSATPPSLQNFGLTCYSNSAIQLLYAIEPLTNILLKSNASLIYPEKPFARQYTTFVQAIKKGNYNDELKKMADLVQEKVGCGQQDLFTFFSLILKELVENPSVKNILQSRLKDFRSNITYPVNKLTLIATNQNTLLDALKVTFNQQKEIILKPAPALIVHLNRDKPSPITVPYSISIKNFVDISYTTPLINYDLIAAAVHSGEDMRSGHWVAYARHGKQWYLCNDTKISNVTNSDGTIKESPSYPLNLSFWCVYQLKDFTPPKPFSPNVQIDKSFSNFFNFFDLQTELENLIDSLAALNQQFIQK